MYIMTEEWIFNLPNFADVLICGRFLFDVETNATQSWLKLFVPTISDLCVNFVLVMFYIYVLYLIAFYYYDLCRWVNLLGLARMNSEFKCNSFVGAT